MTNNAQKPQAPQAKPKTPIRLRKDDEKLSRDRTVLDDNRVRTTFTIKPEGAVREHVVDGAVFDFSGCSRAELLQIATARAVIATQTAAKAARAGGQTLYLEDWQNIDVKKRIVDTERKAASPVDAMMSRLSKLSSADREAFLKMIEEQKPQPQPQK